MVNGEQVSSGIDVHAVPDDGTGRDINDARHPGRGDGGIDPQHPPPARGRQPSVREEQDGQPEESDRRCPAGLEEHRHPAQRQVAMTEPVVGRRIGPGVAAEDQESSGAQHEPAEWVARPPHGQHEAHHPEERNGQDPPAGGAEPLVGETAERPQRHHQRQLQPDEQPGGRGRCQAEAAPCDVPRHGPPPLIHTDTWAGSRAACTTPARSSRTESRSTASFSRAANCATIRSVSYRARLNRRSTVRCTRRRSGWTTAAAASVEAATATCECTDSTRVASSTSPAYSPTSNPVMTAYASVRLIIRSMSNRRYFRIPTPMLTGSAAIPAKASPLSTCKNP